MNETKKTYVDGNQENFWRFFNARYALGRFDFVVGEGFMHMDSYPQDGYLNSILPSDISSDMIKKICAASRCKTINDFMTLFEIKDMKTLADFYGLPVEEMESLLENKDIFDRMKRTLSFIIICDRIITSMVQ